MLKNKKYILNFFLTSLLMMIFIAPLFVLAEEGCTGGGGEGCGGGSGPIEIVNPFKKDSIKGLIETIVNDILMPIGGVIAVMMIMYAGFKYVTAGGDATKIKEAHEALKYAVIGAAILLGAWVISTAIGKTIDQLKT